MKKIFSIIVFTVFAFLLIPKTVEAGSCLKFNGSLTANDFPAGASVKVTCAGDNGPSGCVGDSKVVKPGESFSLEHCSCLADECMRTEIIDAPACNVSSSDFCGTNSDTITAPLTVACPTPTPTPEPCWEDWYCETWKNPSNVPDSDPNYSKYKECFDKGYFAQARKQCDADEWEIKCEEAPQCKVPVDQPTPTFTPTATPTTTQPSDTPTVTETPSATPSTSPSPTPYCNMSCDGNPNICTQATDGCTKCDLTSKRCVPPGSTPTVTVTPTTSIPPTPTVTTSPPPDFDAAACKCDGMTVGPLIAGQNATFTANSKVEGSNVSKATVKSMTFYFGESEKGATNGTALGSSGPIAPQKTSSPNKDSYTASWTYKLPTTVTGKSYRAWATIQCDKNVQAHAGTAKTAVLAAEDTSEEPSFFGKIVNFFKGILGQETDENTDQEESVATTQDSQIEQINLGTVQPGNVTLKACSMLFFEFPEMKK